LEKLTVPLIPVPLGVSVVLALKLSPGEAVDVSVNCQGPLMVFGDELPHPKIKASAITNPRHCADLILSPVYLHGFPPALPDNARARGPKDAWSVPISIPDNKRSVAPR
jgi:hypothetical protein